MQFLVNSSQCLGAVLAHTEVWVVTSRKCGLLHVESVGCYISKVWVVTCRKCGLLHVESVGCYM
jgi:hypothetical protein